MSSIVDPTKFEIERPLPQPRAPLPRAALPAVIFAACLAGACCQQRPFGVVSNAYVVAAGRAGGGVLHSPKPLNGAPLAASLAPAIGCIPGDQLLGRLGPVCDHETENAAAAQPDSDDLDAGKPALTPQVRWYCEGRLTVRVVLVACDSNGDGSLDGIVPSEVAVAFHR